MAPGHFKYACEPAASVIRALGGVRALALALKLTPEAVSRWNRPAETGGTGGFVPLAYRSKILKLAQKQKQTEIVTERLLRQRKEPDMGNSAKRKGDAFEYQVVREMNEAGFNAHRVPLSGAVAGYPGDVSVETPTGRWILQCKISGQRNHIGATVVIRFLHSVAFGRVICKKAKYVAMQRDVFFDLIRGKAQRALNLPVMNTPGEQLGRAITGHDALVFRRDGSKNWYVLVLEEKYRDAE